MGVCGFCRKGRVSARGVGGAGSGLANLNNVRLWGFRAVASYPVPSPWVNGDLHTHMKD